MSERDLLDIPIDILLDLLSALRRHHAADAERQLAHWAASEVQCPDDDDTTWLCLGDELSAWVHHECGLHVREGRFEHALCLVENYRRPFTTSEFAALNRTGDFSR